jgi:hypothetical protein
MVFLVIINGKTTNESSRQIKFRCQSTISVDPLKRHLNVKSMTTVSRRQSEPQTRKKYFMNTILKFGSVALALMGIVLTVSAQGTSFVTNQTLGTLRNNFTGNVGYKFTVGTSPVTVTQFGRWVVAGNSGAHTLTLVRQSDNAPLATVSVPTSGATAGTFKYVALGSPVTLAANTSYYLLSSEGHGADRWYDDNTTLATNQIAVINDSEYYNGTYNNNMTVGHSYVPLDFIYIPLVPNPIPIKVNDFLNSIGTVTHMGQGIDNASSVGPILVYAGIRNIRDDGSTNPTTIQGWINVHKVSGARVSLLPISGNIANSLSEYEQLATAGSLLAVEGPNEPNNFPVTYNGIKSSSTTSLPIAQFQRDLYAAVKADPKLAGIPVFASSEAGGSEPNNVGLQYLTIPSGAGTLMPDGTIYADYANVHNYVCGNLSSPIDNNAWGAEDPTINGRWDGMYVEYGHTWWGPGYNGYSTSQLATLPKVTTETGWVTGAGALTEDQQGKLFLNLYLDAYKRGWSYTFIYMLRDDTTQGYWGLFRTDYTPKLSGKYLHNLTTIVADNTSSFTPGKVNYIIPNEPATVHDMLMQKSNGTYELAVWGEQVTGLNNITVNLGAIYQSVNVYDPTVGTAPIQTLTGVSSVPLTVGDHAFIIEIISAQGLQ